MMATSLERWTLFGLLDVQFVRNIRLAMVFGSLGNEAIILTKDDEVYSFGANIAGCLGLGDNLSYLKPRKIETLCNQNLIGFAFGSGPHNVAFSESGSIYSWGHNGFGELGLGTTGNSNIPVQISGPFESKKVVQVACGSHHTLALTSDGEVYAWGQNNCGQVGGGQNTSNVGSPRKVVATLGGRFVASIACGQASSMAVLDSGEVFSWGYNGSGQLGLGHNVNQLNPCKISSLQGVVISRLVCGFSHTLALSDVGDLYAWGVNNFGQLGNGTKMGESSPIIVASDMGRVTDIAACHYNNHISAAINQNNRVYMWGQCRSQIVTVPTLTPFASMDDVFATFASPSVTFQPLKVDVDSDSSVNECLRNSFDNEETADLVIKVEGKEIKVHRALLIMRCNYFKTMFHGKWAEKEQGVITIDQFSYEVFYAFLKYLYTDEVDLSPEMALELLVLANSYLETGLKKRCEQTIKKGITVENAATLYGSAILYDAKDLENFCFNFSLNHMTAVVMSAGFKSLEEDVVKNFMFKAAQQGAFRH